MDGSTPDSAVLVGGLFLAVAAAGVVAAPDSPGSSAEGLVAPPPIQSHERFGAELSGRVLKGRASEPVADLEVELHRITSREAGVVASETTDRFGGFRFRLDATGTDDFSVHLVTARYQDVLYLGDPVHGRSAPDSEYVVRVYEARTTDSLSVAGRHLAISPDRDGFRVVDVFELVNPSDTTLVPPELPGAGWTLRLPSEAHDLELEASGMEGDDLQVEGSDIVFRGPLSPPGRALVVRYRIPSKLLRLTVDRSYPRLELLLPSGVRGLAVEGLAAAAPAALGEASYLRYAGTDLSAGATVTLRWDEAGRHPWGWILLALSLLFGGGALLTWRAPTRS